METIVEIPIKFKPLLCGKYRYKLYYGGRSGGKSYAFGDSLLLLARSKKIFVACVREVQNSIKDSVYKLLKDRAMHYEFEDFVFYEDRIENIVTGSRFIFKGLQDRNMQNVKSLEGVDICWIEEGQSISKASWEILNPTIRKPQSEIWVSMNREEDNDPIWVALGANPDERTLVVKVNYYDNPFCPEEMKYLAEKCKKEDFDDYLHIWEGEPVQQGDKKLISAVAVKRALLHNIDMANNNQPLIIGVDPARMGDDATAICWRRGRQAFKFEKHRKKNVVEVANIVTSIILQDRPARVNIDAGGLGIGVYDILIDRGYDNVVRAVNFGEKAQDQERYGNRRAEMWARVNDWLNAELPVSIIDKSESILTDLTAPEKKDDKLQRLLLEEKKDIKKRIGRSTDVGDALALTFAEAYYPISIEAPTQEVWVDDNIYF